MNENQNQVESDNNSSSNELQKNNVDMNINTNEKVNVSNNKKGNSTLIIIIVIAIIVIGSILFIVFGTDILKKDKKDNNTDANGNEVVDPVNKYDEVKKFAGRYKKDNEVVLLYPLKSGKVFYTLDGNGFFQGSSEVNGNVLLAKDFFKEKDYYVFTLTDSGLEVSVKDTESVFEGGLFTKEGDYTTEDFFKNNLGDPSLLSSKYSGIFTNANNDELVMYQINDNQVNFGLTNSIKNVSMNNTFNIKSENYLETDADSIDNSITSITIENNNYKLVVNKSDEDYKKFNGTYTKEKDISMEYLIDIMYGNY